MDTQTQMEGAETQAPQLSINDLQQIRAVVDLAARRGAFQGTELSTIGAVYDRLNVFLTAVTSQADAATADAVAPAEVTASAGETQPA